MLLGALQDSSSTAGNLPYSIEPLSAQDRVHGFCGMGFIRYAISLAGKQDKDMFTRISNGYAEYAHLTPRFLARAGRRR